MRKLISVIYVIFVLGLVLKFFHLHYNAIILMSAIGGILILSALQLFQKKYRFSGFLHFVSAIWLIVLFMAVKFFAFGFWALILAIILTSIVLVISFRKNSLEKLKLFSLVILITLIFYFIPTDYRYYILNIKWNYEIDTDYYTWDKYSWFLYQNDHYTEALNASNVAYKIANKANDERMISLIKQHQEAIQNKTWDRYH